MTKNAYALLLACGAAFVGCASFPDAESVRTHAEQSVAEAYPGMPPALTQRAVQDAEQRLCSKGPGETLTSEEAARVVAASRTAIKYPAGNKLSGDWKVGEKLVSNGVGMRVRGGRVEGAKQNGALCINCHALDPAEVNVGNLGPSLTAYGRQRGNSEPVVKYTYEKIYNAWTYFPCSNMPRLGHNGFLTPEQIAHVVAYLVDPQSPVNRP
ncbi:MAG TPA: sulfur oxidation c-type cytochrome SoxX [Burkholderiales bacterium]|nr:sulfur oxidation c-type cytochrome SoxX [Burkholderiales bacterium]